MHVFVEVSIAKPATQELHTPLTAWHEPGAQLAVHTEHGSTPEENLLSGAQLIQVFVPKSYECPARQALHLPVTALQELSAQFAVQIAQASVPRENWLVKAQLVQVGGDPAVRANPGIQALQTPVAALHEPELVAQLAVQGAHANVPKENLLVKAQLTQVFDVEFMAYPA